MPFCVFLVSIITAFFLATKLSLKCHFVCKSNSNLSEIAHSSIPNRGTCGIHMKLRKSNPDPSCHPPKCNQPVHIQRQKEWRMRNASILCWLRGPILRLSSTLDAFIGYFLQSTFGRHMETGRWKVGQSMVMRRAHLRMWGRIGGQDAYACCPSRTIMQ